MEYYTCQYLWDSDTSISIHWVFTELFLLGKYLHPASNDIVLAPWLFVYLLLLVTLYAVYVKG
jgi:hypothetical protein